MPIKPKWILTLGILALSPNIASAGPFGLSNPFKSQKSAEPAAPATSSNQVVAEQVAAALSEAQLTGYDISIEYQNGVATLEGKIQNAQQKQKATEVTQQLAAVTRVENRMQLIETAAPTAMPAAMPVIQQTAYNDPAFGAPVSQAAFEATPATEAAPIQQVAAAVPAAQKMQNQQVANSIAYALRDSGVAGYDIEISFKDGVATLAGAVSNGEQRQYVESVTSQVPMVQRVDNQLQVQAAAPQSPIVQTSFDPVPGAGAPAGGPIPGQMAPPPAMAGPGPGGPAMMPPGPVMGHPGPGPVSPVYNQPYLPKHAWPTYAAYPNYAGVTYPKQYSASAFPYIGPFYPYPQVPLGWRSSTLEWDDGQWQLKFSPKTDRWWWFMNPKNWD